MWIPICKNNTVKFWPFSSVTIDIPTRRGNVSWPFSLLISNHYLYEKGPKCNSGIIRPQEISVGATILLLVIVM